MSRGNTRSGPRRKAATDGTRPEYPSVREYLLSRRDVLGYLGVSVVVAGAGALFQGCGGLLPDAAGGISDGSTTYLTMRVPIQGDLSVELADAAQCRFFVNALSPGIAHATLTILEMAI